MFPDRSWGPGDNPKTAVHEFLRHTRAFEIDAALEAKLQITVAPDGIFKADRLNPPKFISAWAVEVLLLRLKSQAFVAAHAYILDAVLPSCSLDLTGLSGLMNIQIKLLRFKGFRFSREIIAHAIWAYHRFALSLASYENRAAA